MIGNNLGKRLIIESEARPFELTDQQCETLLEIAGYDYYPSDEAFRSSLKHLYSEQSEREYSTEIDAEAAAAREDYYFSGKLLNKVRYLLGCYPDLVANLDNGPTGKSISEEMTQIKKLAENLYSSLSKLSVHAKSELAHKSFEQMQIDQLLKVLGIMHDDAQKIIQEKRREESRGTKKKLARETLIDHLARCFNEFAKDPNLTAKVEFIKFSLDYAKIEHPENIRRLLRNAKTKRYIINQNQ